MSAKNSSARTSKTAHVMNLLNKGRPAPEESPPPEESPVPAEEVSSPSVPEPQQAPPHTVPFTAMVDTSEADSALSDQIKGALEEELLGMLPPQEAAPEEETTEMEESPAEAAEPVTEAVPVPAAEEPPPAVQPAAEAEEAPAPMAEEAPSTAAPQPPEEPTAPPPPAAAATVEAPRAADVPTPAPAPQPAAPKEPVPPVQTAAAPAPAVQPEQAPPAFDPDRIEYVNVMQALVEEKAAKYMKMFGLCQCPRCVIDVKALALSNLPPKYVVMRQGEMIPRITIYESRYSTAVIAQIMQACKTVMESPRHET